MGGGQPGQGPGAGLQNSGIGMGLNMLGGGGATTGAQMHAARKEKGRQGILAGPAGFEKLLSTPAVPGMPTLPIPPLAGMASGAIGQDNSSPIFQSRLRYRGDLNRARA